MVVDYCVLESLDIQEAGSLFRGMRIRKEGADGMR